MSTHLEADHQIRRALAAYCDTLDRADFTAFAQLFEHGQWFMVDGPGVEPVLSWIADNIILYDGRTHTRHEITNIAVDLADSGDVADFRCYLSIWQHLPAQQPELLAHVRFAGDFVDDGGRWRWRSHRMTPDFTGDLSRHIRGPVPE